MDHNSQALQRSKAAIIYSSLTVINGLPTVLKDGGTQRPAKVLSKPRLSGCYCAIDDIASELCFSSSFLYHHTVVTVPTNKEKR